MNEKRLVENIKGFTKSHNLELTIRTVTGIGVQINYYRFIERNTIFYELKHGADKFRIYSNIPKGTNLKIQASNPFLGRRSLRITGLNHTMISNRIEQLNELLDSFTWESHFGYLSWPEALRNSQFLAFESADILKCSEHLNLLRELHIGLTGYLNNVSS